MPYDTFHISYQVKEVPDKIAELKEESVYWLNLKWVPTYNNFQEVNGYKTVINNLDLRFKYGIITLKNSLHKFYMGNNYEPFSYKQVINAFKKLNTMLPFNIYEANVTLIALGIVMNIETKPIIDTWLTLNGKEFIPMMSNNKIYGAKYYLTDYDVKGYNKTVEVYDHIRVKLKQQLFRFELEIKTRNLNKRKNAIGIYTVQDLVNEHKFKLLCAELMNKYKAILKKGNVPLSKLNNKEKEAVALFENNEICTQYKIDHKHSYKKKRAVYIQTKKLTNDNFLRDIENKIQEQINVAMQ